MTHKQECIAHCKDVLEQRQLSKYFNQKDFEHIYKKFSGCNGNAYNVALNAADFIIINAKFQNDETGND